MSKLSSAIQDSLDDITMTLSGLFSIFLNLAKVHPSSENALYDCCHRPSSTSPDMCSNNYRQHSFKIRNKNELNTWESLVFIFYHLIKQTFASGINITVYTAVNCIGRQPEHHMCKITTAVTQGSSQPVIVIYSGSLLWSCERGKVATHTSRWRGKNRCCVLLVLSNPTMSQTEAIMQRSYHLTARLKPVTAPWRRYKVWTQNDSLKPNNKTWLCSTSESLSAFAIRYQPCEGQLWLLSWNVCWCPLHLTHYKILLCMVCR